jgi:hypothetical protein
MFHPKDIILRDAPGRVPVLILPDILFWIPDLAIEKFHKSPPSL